MATDLKNVTYTITSTRITDIIGSTNKTYNKFDTIECYGSDRYRILMKNGSSIAIYLEKNYFHYYNNSPKVIYSSERCKKEYSYKQQKLIEGKIFDSDIKKIKKLIIKLMLKK
jgi:hypothetical protein